MQKNTRNPCSLLFFLVVLGSCFLKKAASIVGETIVLEDNESDWSSIKLLFGYQEKPDDDKHSVPA